MSIETGHDRIEDFLGEAQGDILSLGEYGSPSSLRDLAESPERSLASGSRTASPDAQGESPLPSRSSHLAKWGTSLKSRWEATKGAVEATKQAVQARKEEVQDAVLERGRMLHHKSRNLVLDAKETVMEKRQDFVQNFVNGLEGVEVPEGQGKREAVAVELTQRWWAAACAAAHIPHDPASDPLPGLDAEGTSSEEKGPLALLEVEVLHFSEEPPLLCEGERRATAPVLQLACGGRITGALRPQGASKMPADGTPRPEGEAPSPGGSLTEGPVSKARFAVQEVFGADLRLHVFDRDSTKFSLGMEDRAFCGGAIVPLSAVMRHHHGPLGPLHAVVNTEFSSRLAVRLLPLEALRLGSKMQRAEASGLERPKEALGCVVLELRLILCERWTPAWVYLKLPYCGDDRGDEVCDGAQLDNPMSVLKAVGRSVERLSRALNPEVFVSALERLRERAATALFLQCLWAYYALWAPVWKVPGCLAAAVVALAAEVSFFGAGPEAARMFRDEVAGGEVGDLSRMERTKQKVSQAVKMEVRMLQFARKCAHAALVAEKLRYILTLQDPQLSAILACVLLAAVAGATFWLRVAAVLLGQKLGCVLLWMPGCLVLLPGKGRAIVREGVQRLLAWKERILGPGRWKAILLALWRRIPDAPERTHCELAERYVLLPENEK